MFHRAIIDGAQLAQLGYLVTFGIVPTHAETGYGYIRIGESLHRAHGHGIRAFVEKPDKKTAAGAVATEQQIAAWRDIFSKPIPGGPGTRGFDLYFGTDVPNWPPFCFIENHRTLGVPTEFLPREYMVKNQASQQGPALKDWKLEGILPALGDRTVRFIDESVRKKEPFLIYMPLTFRLVEPE